MTNENVIFGEKKATYEEEKELIEQFKKGVPSKTSVNIQTTMPETMHGR